MTEATQPAKPAATRKQVDWEAVELRYRAGTESLRCIAADFQITEGAIRLRAKKESWTRDLSARVEQATKAKLLRKAATHDDRPRSSKETEREVIEIEAETRVSVILRHRKDVRSAINLTTGMLEELKTETEKKSPLAKRAPVIKQLTEALRIQVGLERQAFGIVGEEAEQPEHLTNAVAAAAVASKTLSDAERAIRLARMLRTMPVLPEPAA